MSVPWQVSTLDNGLRVVTTPVATAESVSVNVFVGVGSRAEDRRLNGVSHYVEHMLFKGTERRPTAIAIAEAIEGAGGVLNAYTSKELTCYWNHVPFNRLELAMDVLTDMVRSSMVDAGELDRERSVVQQEIRRSYDQPGSWAAELLARAVFGDQPMGWPIAGTLETVGEMSRADLLGHVGGWYVPANAVLSVAGKTTHEEVVALAQRLWGDIAAAETPLSPPATDGMPADRVIVEKREIAQCNVGIGLRAIPRLDPDRYALTILNTVLGRGMSSRLFREVREKRGLAYSVGSSVSRYNDVGTMTVSAGVTLEHLEEAVRVIRAELQKMVDEPVGEEELAKARDYSTGSFRLGLETTMALVQRAGEALLMTGEIEPVEQVVERLGAVSAADVQRVAARVIGPGEMALAAVGPGGDPNRLTDLLAAA